MSAPVPPRARIAGLLFAGALLAIAATSRASAAEVAAPPPREPAIAVATHAAPLTRVLDHRRSNLPPP
jgi:hypothetical protein